MSILIMRVTKLKNDIYVKFSLQVMKNTNYEAPVECVS